MKTSLPSVSFSKAARMAKLPATTIFCSALALVFLALFGSAATAQTYTGDLTLATQAEVDAFNYTSVTGTLNIQGSSGTAITNLNGLSELTSVGGNLFIGSNNALTNLTGLNAITSVGGTLIIGSNSVLTSLTGLNAITSVGGIIINTNPALASLAPLNAITSVAGNLNINNNGALTNLTGLNAITSVGGTLSIASNSGLTNLTGLNAITSVGGLAISGSSTLTSLAALSAITSVAGNLSISSIGGLTNLTGLNSITSVPGFLNISNNGALTNLTGLNAITSVGGHLSIEGNNALTDLTALNAITSVGGLRVQSNQVLTNLTGLNAITSVGGGLTILGNPALTSLAPLNAITSVGGTLVINSNNALTNLTGLNAITSVAGIEIFYNNALTNLTGLNAIASAGFISIEGNNALTNITALGAITSAVSDINITSNMALTSLTGLDNISSSALSYLLILDNPNLSACAVESICDYLSVPSNSADILLNMGDCEDRPAVEAACLALPVELIDFKAVLTNDKLAKLYWRTASENHNKGFEIEWSMNGTSWKMLDFVPGNGNSHSEKTYQFVDERPQPGTNYYRLRQVDFDGRFEYSKVISLKMKAKKENAGTFYPNPSKSGIVQLDYFAQQDETLSVAVFDVSGKLVLQNTKPVSSGDARWIFNFSQLTAGAYIVEVGDETNRMHRKLIIEK